MSEFKIGEKVLLVDTRVLYPRHVREGGIYSVLKVNGDFITLTDDAKSFSECVYAHRLYKIVLLDKEKEMEQTAEQIREEILRTDSRIEEAKKDIENADKERTALVEKLREKGFEIVGSNPAILPGDLVRIIGTQSPRHSENHVGKKGVVEKVDDSDVPYKVILSGSDEASNTWFNSDQVQKI